MNVHSKRIRNKDQIARFIADDRNTFLVSFPRTGSHWLRMLMELYFERPTLVRTFYYPDSTDFMVLHTHDMDLSLQRSHVIYLYRNPVDTIFSQICYEKESPDDISRIKHWSSLYCQHLAKWLHEENFTIMKTIISYDEMTTDLAEAFVKITSHFNQPLDRDRLLRKAQSVTKHEVRSKTLHDKQVVQLSGTYDDRRLAFKHSHSSFIWDIVLTGCPYLESYFGCSDSLQC